MKRQVFFNSWKNPAKMKEKWEKTPQGYTILDWQLNKIIQNNIANTKQYS